MIHAAAFCPHPPLLIPAVGAGTDTELEPLRSACLNAVRSIAAADRSLVLLGSGPTAQTHSPLARGSMAAFGVDLDLTLGAVGCGGSTVLPLSLTVGAWLVRTALGPHSGAVAIEVGLDFATSAAAREALALLDRPDVALLVMGDGSARRSTAAPGYFDERAEGFDATVATALATGDRDALAALDPGLGFDLLSAGGPAWVTAAGMLDAPAYRATVSYADAPFGVGYMVATWLADG